MRVLVAGAGIGGLALAQGLRRRGVEVAVFERDPAAVARGQGYRLRIDAGGNEALARCLPDDLFALYRATANRPYISRGNVFDEQLNLVYSAVPPSGAASAAERADSTAVNRLTLRQVLLAGLDDVVHFGHELVHAEQSATGVVARFAGGGRADGDLLVGADGIGSAVRRQLLPRAGVLDTGMRAVYGRAELDTELRALLPDSLFGGTSAVLGPQRHTMALGTFEPCHRPGEAAARIAPYARLDPVPDYMKWTLVAPAAAYGLPEPELWQAEPDVLTRLAAGMTSSWHRAIRELLARSDPATTFFLAIRSALPVPAWPPGRVTLLGDAIHATTPVGGTGANVALRDAAVLADRLAAAGHGHGGLLEAVAGYESAMRDYGFTAVTRSLRGAERILRVEPAAVG
ncbi:MAG TPA: FAD-dependent monooxygenase [Streptosporangiaceae bacterium]|jgi:2-polyprenyl-6-methoxyphenol hydroxylase-like FAD-dependent oxidoreductase